MQPIWYQIKALLKMNVLLEHIHTLRLITTPILQDMNYNEVLSTKHGAVHHHNAIYNLKPEIQFASHV